MTEPKRLSAIDDVAATVTRPDYMPSAHGVGIVHIGAGAFCRAHTAVYTDAAIGAAGGDWRMTGVSLRGTDVADALNPQNGLFTLIERGAGGDRARLIGAMAGVLTGARDRVAILAAMANPATRIVSLTVTEKAYGIDRTARGIDRGHAAVAADLAEPRNPSGVLGLLAEALRRRREQGVPPFTVLCCDNLPDNGGLVRAGTIDFARQVDPELAAFVEDAVAFPSTMVDRITPASTRTTLDDAAHLIGCVDLGAVETEPFCQWVIEDRFTAGRPQWEAGGAIFATDVAPYERMKLRMLNGTHSMLAYAGFLSGRRFVRDVMADADLAVLVARHLEAAAATLEPLAGVDLRQYGQALRERFANPSIAHETFQIAMDGTEKLPQRILQPAAESLATGRDIRPFAFATAAWMRYCLGRDDDGTAYALRDPRQDEIGRVLAGANEAEAISAALHGLPGLFPDALRSAANWRACVGAFLDAILRRGMRAAVRDEAHRLR